MRMGKTPNNSTKKSASVKSVSNPANLKPWFNEYYRDMATLRMHPVSEGYILKFAIEWVEWALDPKNNCTTLEEFFIHKRINTRTVYRWMERSEDLRDSHDFVKEYLYTKRDKGATERRYDSAYVKLSMPLYSEKFKDLEEWRAKLASKIAAASTVPYVVVEKFE